MMFFSRTASFRPARSPTVTLPIGPSDLLGSVSKTAAMLIPCSAKIGELAIA